MIKKSFAIIVSVLSLVVLSCEAPSSGVGNSGGEPENYEKREDLFVPSLSDPSNTDKCEIILNDTKYIKAEGYTFWCEPYINSSSSFETIEVELEKPYGDSKSGYGVVFNSYRDVDSSYMLTVMINNEQKYIVGRVKNGKFKKITDGWIRCDVLEPKGAGKNTIKIEYDVDGSSQNKFKVTFKNSNTEQYSFTFADTENTHPVFKDTRYGYVAVVSPMEYRNGDYLIVEFEKK